MIYLIKLADLEPNFHDLCDLTGEKKKAQIHSDKLFQTKLSHLASGLLYRFCLGHNYEELLQFNEHGKPFSCNGPFFNISHSKDYAALYIGDNQCGIDIEKIDAHRMAISDKAFTNEEITRINNNPESFFKLWTRKESIAKALGTGFAYPFNKINALQKDFICNEKKYYTETFKYDNNIISVTEKNKLPLTSVKVLSINELIK